MPRSTDGTGSGKAIRRWLPAAALFLGGSALFGLVIAIDLDPFLLTGSTEPATIVGPALGVGWIAAVATLLLAVGAFGRGRARLVLLAWLAFVAIATHRMVEYPDGRVEDRWFTLAVQTLSAEAASEPAGSRCTIGRWLVRCADPATMATLVTPTVLPFVAPSPGAANGIAD